MARSILTIVTLATVLAMAAGCQLVVPSESELSGGAKPAPSAGDGGALPEAGGGGTTGDGGDSASGVRLVQQTTAQAASARSLAIALPNATASGSALVLTSGSIESTPVSVSGGGARWTQLSASAQHVALAVWFGLVDPGQLPGEVVVTFASSPDPAQPAVGLHLAEWSGLAALSSSTLNDPARTALAAGGGDPISTRPLIVPDRAGLVFAAAAGHNFAIGAPSAGFVPVQSVETGDLRLVAAYKLAPPAGSYSTSWTYPTTDSWDAHIDAFMK